MAKKSHRSQIVKMGTLPRQDYLLRITLDGSDPPIWRRFRVPADTTLADLHHVIQIVMGWENAHLHAFQADGRRFQSRTDPFGIPMPDMTWPGEWRDEDSVKVKLRDVVRGPGDTLHYEYDFGDSWEHTIVLEDIVTEPEKQRYVCLAGERACPPEDCGGIWGYMDILYALQHPEDQTRNEQLEWLEDAYGTFDPNEFDREAVNTSLKGLR